MNELSKKAVSLLTTSLLLTPENKEKWLRYVKQMTAAQLEKLIGVLDQEGDFLNKALKKTIKKLAEKGDKESLEKLNRILKRLKKKSCQVEERCLIEEEENELEDLEKQIKDL